MTQHLRLLPLAFCIASTSACLGSDEHEIGRIEFVDGPRRARREPARPPGPSPHPPTPPGGPPAWPRLAAFTELGEVALVDGATGAVLGAAPAGESVGVRDLSYDPWGQRLVVFESDEDEQGGEITTYALAGSPAAPKLLGREHRVWVDGVARVAASPLGIVVFEDGYGPRWKVLWNDGTPSQGVAASRPASAWLTVHASGFMIHALTYGDAWLPPALDVRRAEIHLDSLLEPTGSALGLAPASDPPTARLVPTPALGEAALLDVEAGVPTIRLVDASGPAEAVEIPVGHAIGRVEHAVALDGGEIVVLLTSDPASLIAAKIAPTGAIHALGAVGLPGEARVEAQFFSRDLTALGAHRVLAATSTGVFAFDVAVGAGGLTLVPVASFHGAKLRGPLDPIVAPPG